MDWSCASLRIGVFLGVYGTNLLRGGANIRVVQELMRHESLATTAGYLQVEESERVEAIRRLSA